MYNKKDGRGGKNKLTQSELIDSFTEMHGYDFDYSNVVYVNINTPIEVRCKKHNITFSKKIQNYLSGSGCPKCSAENYNKLRAISKEEYYERIAKEYGGKYAYFDDYISTKDSIKFKCDVHGIITRNAYNHLNGYGCPYCNENGRQISKITKEGYCRLAKDRITTLYLIECSKDGEKFYKIGKTFQKIKNRFTKSKIPYKVRLVGSYKSSADEIWDLEEEMHKKYKEYLYKPKKYFAGFTECYNLNLPLDKIWKIL